MGVSYNRFLDRLDSRVGSRRNSASRIHESRGRISRRGRKIHESSGPKVNLASVFYDEELKKYKSEAKLFEKVFKGAVKTGLDYIDKMTSEESSSYNQSSIPYFETNLAQFDIRNSGMRAIDVDLDRVKDDSGELTYYDEEIHGNKKNGYEVVQKEIGFHLYWRIMDHIDDNLDSPEMRMEDGSKVAIEVTLSDDERVVAVELVRR